MSGRRPDYDLSALDKKTDLKGRVGAAWINDNGTISIRLNPWVVLDGSNKDLVLTLFVSEEGKKKPSRNAKLYDESFDTTQGGKDPPPY